MTSSPTKRQKLDASNAAAFVAGALQQDPPAAMPPTNIPVLVCDNLLNGSFVPPLAAGSGSAASASYLDVHSPVSGQLIAKVALSSSHDVDLAVSNAQQAFLSWSRLTVKARAAIMLRFHALIQQHSQELASMVVLENGKNQMEALASVMKGNETVEYACSLPQLIQGKMLQVSRGITCQEVRAPLGVVASIVPFNFPIMVPMWTVPIALTMGNCVILKPSEKVPMTMHRVAELMKEAGIPDGVFQIINGKEEAVQSLCDHPGISAVTFVGSSRVAQLVSRRCRALDKRVLALGGAKNHLVALPDADNEVAAKDIVASFAGCAGQRCMAASVLLLVGNCDELLRLVVEKSKNLTRGVDAGQVGAIIDPASKEKILKYIAMSEANGAQILVDGRSWAKEKHGNWVGPTIILHASAQDEAMREEIFGPVLSVYQVQTFEEALQIENANDYGNAASIYTSNGGYAEYFQSRFRAAMIGVNIGIPVPREPFSFGGLYGTKSKFGDMDITGDGAVEFFSNRIKITTKWTGQPSGPGLGATVIGGGSAASTLCMPPMQKRWLQRQ